MNVLVDPLQFGPVFATPLGKLFVAIVAIAVVVLVGRLVLRVAWRLVTIAALIVGLLLVVSLFAPGLF